MKDVIINTLKDLLKYKTYKENKEEFINLYKMIKDNYNSLYIKEYNFDDRLAMVLSNSEDTNLDIIFCCHIDVVHADNYDYYEDDDNIYGRGTIDMKSSAAVCLTIMKNLDTNLKIGLFLTSDEEIDGYSADELSKLYTSKICIVPDGGSNFKFIKEEKGLLQLELSINTETAHAAQLFNGENAIVKLMNIYNKIIDKYPNPTSSKEYITSVNLSKIDGGDSYNQVPGYAKMILDIRNTSNDKQDDIIEFIKGIDSNLNISIITQGDIFESDLNNKLVKKYISTCEKVLEKPIEMIGCESTSDAIFFSSKNIPTVIMNPKGDYAHSPKEFVNKDSLLTLYNIYDEFIKGVENNA